MIDDYFVERYIKPCPFCGGAASPDRSWRDAWVSCHGCGARGKTFPRKDWIKAIEAWNHRDKE